MWLISQIDLERFDSIIDYNTQKYHGNCFRMMFSIIKDSEIQHFNIPSDLQFENYRTVLARQKNQKEVSKK